jgi:D-tyrosyl-tRNA(Tyr) deacylase
VITTVQRCASASVTVDGAVVGAIEKGLLLFVCVEDGDTEADAQETARKLVALRCFPDRTPMDLSVAQAGGSCLVVSQFTLAAELRHGNRPDFTGAAAPDLARALYEQVAAGIAAAGIPVARGVFGAKMLVQLANDGPVTLLLRVRGGKARTLRADAPTGG